MSEQSKIDERRQRAREAWYDNHNAIDGGDIDDAIETATRVKITDEAVTCLLYASDMRDALATALAELGFEVES